MVITFSNIKGSGGGGGATGGTVSGITLWSDETTMAYVDSAVTQAVETAVTSAVTEALTAYTPTSGFSTINGSAITSGDNLVIEGTPYSGGTGISVDNHIISVTGDYETVIELTQAQYDALTAYSENTTYIITDAPSINMSAYTPTSGFSTINGSAITVGGNIEIVYSAGTNIDITDNVISVTGITVPTKLSDLENDEGFITTADTQDFVTSADVKTQIEGYNYINSGQAQTQIDNSISGKADTTALTQYYTSAQTDTAIDNAVSGKMDTSAMSAYTQTSGFSTINGSAITEGGNIEIVYSAGTNIDITDNVISVTGITVPTKTSDLQNDSGFITANDIPTSNTAFTNDAGYITTADTQNFVTSGDVKTQIEGYNYVNSGDVQSQINDSISGKVDTSAMTAYWTSAETENAISSATEDFVTSADVETQITNKGYITGYTETDPVFQASAASGITANDIQNWDSKLDSTALTPYYTSAQTDTAISNATSGLATEQYVDNSVSGKVDTSALTEYWTSAQTNSAITAATDDMATQTWVGQQGYLTAFTETDPVFQASAASGISAQDILDWDAKLDSSDLIPYYTSAQTDTAISNAVSGLASTTYVDNSVSGKADSSAVTADIAAATAATTGWVENQGYLTAFTESDPVFMSSAASGITANDIQNWNSVSGKQDTLISGTNIKTINNESILGSGNINISGGSGSVVDYNPLQIEFSPEYSYINYYELVFNGSARQFAGRVAFDTINGYTIFHSSDNDKVNWTIPTTGDIQTQINNSVSGKVDTTAMTQYYTSAQTDTAISNATSGLQETLVSGTNIKTINNESILGSGNIVISGGSGGSANIIELTQAEYDALTAYTPDAMYVITDAQEININNYVTTGDLGSYYTSAQTNTAISNAVSGKTDKVSVTASSSGYKFPRWNSQGCITGTTATAYQASQNINGSSRTLYSTSSSSLPRIYAPTSAGSAGQPLLSNGSGAPTWGSYKFQFLSQSQYDALATKDSTTIYFIIDEN